MKQCTKCQLWKDINEFPNLTRSKDGKYPQCKSCKKQADKTDYLKHRDVRRSSQKKYNTRNLHRRRQQGREWRRKNIEEIKEYQKKYYLNNKEKLKNRSLEWAKKNSNKKKQWIENNREKIRQRDNQKYQKNIKLRITKSMASNIRSQLLGITGITDIVKSRLGYSIEQLKIHLESLFEPGMNWDNYGRVDQEGNQRGIWWEIDHIVPKSKFCYNSYEDEEFKTCWSLNNLRPLWASQNRSEGNRR
jgi:hypothetical protein